VRDAGVQAAQRQQRVLDGVLAQDGHRPLGRQAAIQQRLADAARRLQRLRVRHAAPVAGAAVGQPLAPGDEGAIGRRGGPVQQVVGHAPGARLQVLVGAQVAHAAGAFAHLDAGDAEGERPVAARRRRS
jgi:hypothetical protein